MPFHRIVRPDEIILREVRTGRGARKSSRARSAASPTGASSRLRISAILKQSSVAELQKELCNRLENLGTCISVRQAGMCVHRGTCCVPPRSRCWWWTDSPTLRRLPVSGLLPSENPQPLEGLPYYLVSLPDGTLQSWVRTMPERARLDLRKLLKLLGERRKAASRSCRPRGSKTFERGLDRALQQMTYEEPLLRDHRLALMGY